MDLLLQRAQNLSATTGRTDFKLHAQVDFDEEENALTKKYNLDKTVLIAVDQPGLFRNSIIVIFLCFVVLTPIIAWNLFREIALGWTGVYAISLALSIAVGFFYYHQKRETIYLRDLIHGRYFKCPSIIELAKKEAWLDGTVSMLRQVMETAKHWDGTERREILPLPPEDAKRAVIRSI